MATALFLRGILILGTPHAARLLLQSDRANLAQRADGRHPQGMFRCRARLHRCLFTDKVTRQRS